MLKNKSFLAIIPARGGSKRLPRKNILELNGKPLIVWSIESGLKSRYIDDVIVTSDDDDILSIAKKNNSQIIKRPVNLAEDLSTTFDTVKHVIDTVKVYDYIVLLQPTSPLRTFVDIDAAIETLDKKGADAIISVSKADHSPLWCNILPADGSMSDFIKDEIKSTRSQDLPEFFRLNGAIYIVKTDRLLSEKTFFIKDNIYSYIMDSDVSVDIDNEIDFKMAEFMMQELHFK